MKDGKGKNRGEAWQEKAKEHLWVNLTKVVPVYEDLAYLLIGQFCQVLSTFEHYWHRWDICDIWWQEVLNGVDGPTQLLWFMTFVHVPLSFCSLESSFLHTNVYLACLWRALYVVLLESDCLIRAVCKYSMLLLITYLAYLSLSDFSSKTGVALLWERTKQFFSPFLLISWVGVSVLYGRSIFSLPSRYMAKQGKAIHHLNCPRLSLSDLIAQWAE